MNLAKKKSGPEKEYEEFFIKELRQSMRPIDKIVGSGLAKEEQVAALTRLIKYATIRLQEINNENGLGDSEHEGREDQQVLLPTVRSRDGAEQAND